MKNYQKEAADLLKKLGVRFSTKFIEYGIYFTGDKDSRDIYRVTFSRPDLHTEKGIERDGGRFSIKFGQSINDSDGGGGNPPTEYDVLSCIQKYEVGSFENFCGDFGYDQDSRTAERTYKAVFKEFEKVSRFFTSDELKQLQEIN